MDSQNTLLIHGAGDKIIVNKVLRAEKVNFCTGKDCILIDDYDRNIAEWEKNGGTGILFTTAEEVMEKIRKLAAEN